MRSEIMRRQYELISQTVSHGNVSAVSVIWAPKRPVCAATVQPREYTTPQRQQKPMLLALFKDGSMFDALEKRETQGLRPTLELKLKDGKNSLWVGILTKGGTTVS